MTVGFFIKDGQGKNKSAKVSDNNEILTTNQFSQATKITLVSDNTPINLVKPRAGEKLIITGLIVNTNRDIGVNGALIEIYEASSELASTVDKAILSFDLIKNQTAITSPLLIETTAGKFINAKADDSQVNVTILGYFVSS